MKTKKHGIEKSLKIKGKSLPGYRRAKWILSPLCLPFHHTGILKYSTTDRRLRQERKIPCVRRTEAGVPLLGQEDAGEDRKSCRFFVCSAILIKVNVCFIIQVLPQYVGIGLHGSEY